VGHATRTSVTTRSRFGRGARHRSIRLREPPASGALRLPALHHMTTRAFVRQIGRGLRRIFRNESNDLSILNRDICQEKTDIVDADVCVIASQRDRAKSRVPVTSSQSNSARSRTHRGFEIFFVDGGA
jgi:hypothetical protein